MKRTKTTVPICVYKYRLYEPLGPGAEQAAEAFAGARIHYNKLITIERRRRDEYRRARSHLFPELAALEVRQAELDEKVASARAEIQAEKSRSRSRAVAPEKSSALAELVALKKTSLSLLRAARTETRRSVSFLMESDLIDDRARREIAALRPGTYFGTYLLVEAAAEAARGSKTDPDYNVDPPHRLKSRVGVHFCQGESVARVVGGDSTLMRIAPVAFKIGKNGEEKASGRAARTTLLFRVGSEGSARSPVWAAFPMVMHRPLPADARIKKAYVTRKRLTVRTPWQYHLCVVLEAPGYHRTLPGTRQEGTTTVNFGWRMTERGIRVATLSRDGLEVEEVLLPPSYLELEQKRRDLSEIRSSRLQRGQGAAHHLDGRARVPRGFPRVLRLPRHLELPPPLHGPHGLLAGAQVRGRRGDLRAASGSGVAGGQAGAREQRSLEERGRGPCIVAGPLPPPADLARQRPTQARILARRLLQVRGQEGRHHLGARVRRDLRHAQCGPAPETREP